MLVRERHSRPATWPQYSQQKNRGWARFFFRVEWFCEWAAWALSRWAFLEVLEYLSTLSVLVAVVYYFIDAPHRVRQVHYQAWQVINTSQGKGGSGGRIEALQQLNQDRISLTGVDAAGAFLQGVKLEGARMSRCDLEAADLRDAGFRGADLSHCNLHSANFRNAGFEGADLSQTSLSEADLAGANLRAANLNGADLSDADLGYADFQDARVEHLASAAHANIHGAKNLSTAAKAVLIASGAIDIAANETADR
ncbi:MAG: pentapeptide repeat-containing protein [Acidobacteriaceae bacterium]|nr:pentapeptide repeat-containing protein [Acidobacteriaceae bacterium]